MRHVNPGDMSPWISRRTSGRRQSGHRQDSCPVTACDSQYGANTGNPRAIIIAGTKSGVGKTTITLGIIGALEEMGLKVQPFKVGPDFIDAGLHGLFTGGRAMGQNLDTWMLDVEENRRIFHERSLLADISIIEGVMGLFDGAPPHRDPGSTAHVAKVLGVPVVLVIDCHGMAGSILPLIKGFIEYDRGISIKGVILNRVGSERHARFLQELIQADFPSLEVIGAIPRNTGIEIPSRHLGLHTAEDLSNAEDLVRRLIETIQAHTDMDAIVAMAGHTREIPGSPSTHMHDTCAARSTNKEDVRIGIAMDQAFSFYYEENLASLERNGARLIFFSPLKDTRLPDLDAVYLGGGYPELFADALSQNRAMLHALTDRINRGMPCYGECGGMMYLSRGIHLTDGTFFPMVGALPFSVRMLDGMRSLGYREVEFRSSCILGNAGTKARGHEFHYSEIVDQWANNWQPAYITKNARGEPVGDQGYLDHNILSSYVHLHFCSNSSIARNFVEYARSR